MMEINMADHRFGNYSSCCRLCLSENTNSLKSVFDNAAESSSLSQRIHASIGIAIKESDKLSTLICRPCINKLDQWEKYKNLCMKNQDKLESWMNTWDAHHIAEVSFQIKDENLDEETSEPTRSIKEEPMETDQIVSRVDEQFDEDLPPPLTPHPPEERMEDNLQLKLSNLTKEDSFNKISVDSRSCTICDKVFSTVGNRKKHERIIHGRKDKSIGEDEGSQSSEACTEDENSSMHSAIIGLQADSKNASATPSIADGFISESDHQKIQFAAKLKLQLQHHASPSPNPFTFNGFTKIELSYIEKCKAMIKMNQTYICVCHNEQHQSFKQILQHIRKNPIWFPCYTCFNCMITFTDRSTYMKHYVSCPKEKLQNLKRLSETRENTEMKVRLYQVYMCMICNFIFSYHEDFCQHVNTFHIGESETETSCKKCGTVFETIDAVRRHMYLSSCMMNYRCDICSKNFSSMTEFKVHCEQEHDNSEGFSLEYNDNFRKRSTVCAEYNRRSQEIKRRSQDASRSVQQNSHMTPEPEKVINPHAFIKSNGGKNRRSSCHICGKVYSNYHNMLRHAKTHDESLNTLKCSQCPETFRLIIQLRQHENEVHNIQKSPEQPSAPKTTSRVTREFRFTCPECGSSFRDLGEFMKHKEIHKLPCDECGKVFETQNELDQHRSVHLNIKVYRDSKTHNYKSSMVSAMLMCEVCDKIFSTKNELCQHKLLHEQMPVLTAQDGSEEEKKDNTKKYSCEICNKTYLGYGGLWDHNNKHHPGRKIPREYPRQCNYCDKMLFTGGSWYMHKQMHERLSQQALNVSKSNQINDMKTSHPRKSNKDSDDAESYYTCKKCFKVFSSKYNLKNHMKCHGISTSPSRAQIKLGKQSKTYWCDICHQACQGFSELQKHKQEHVDEGIPHLNNEKRLEEPNKFHIFLCDICDKDFTTKMALKKHKERHDLESSPIQKKKYFYCKHCKIPFKNMTILEEHMQGEHNESVMPKTATKATNPISNKHPCGVCKKVFDTASALSSHQGWHKRGKVEKALRTQEKLFRKMVNKIPKKEPQPLNQCDICLMQFPNETALQIHILEAHRKIESNVIIPRCDSCNIDFDSQSAYEKHLQLHKVVEEQKSNVKMEFPPSGKIMKSHPCKYCPSQFTRNDTLNAHMREKHREHVQKEFVCKLCNRVFEKQNALSTHLKVHEREKQHASSGAEKSIDKLPKKFYSCSICHVGFQIAKDLRNHIITSHPF